MAKYLALKKTWLSHENRLIEEGQEFDTEFPATPSGEPMRLSDNIVLLKDSRRGPRAKSQSDTEDESGAEEQIG